jgi:hypothetical protein
MSGVVGSVYSKRWQALHQRLVEENPTRKKWYLVTDGQASDEKETTVTPEHVVVVSHDVEYTQNHQDTWRLHPHVHPSCLYYVGGTNGQKEFWVQQVERSTIAAWDRSASSHVSIDLGCFVTPADQRVAETQNDVPLSLPALSSLEQCQSMIQAFDAQHDAKNTEQLALVGRVAMDILALHSIDGLLASFSPSQRTVAKALLYAAWCTSPRRS